MAAKAEQVFLKKFLNRVDPPKKISQATDCMLLGTFDSERGRRDLSSLLRSTC